MCMSLPFIAARYLLTTTFNFVSSIFVKKDLDTKPALDVAQSSTETQTMNSQVGTMPLPVTAAGTQSGNSAPSPPSSPENSVLATPKTKPTTNQAGINLSVITRARHAIDHVNNRTHTGYTYRIPIQPTKPNLDSLDKKRCFNDLIAGLRVVRGVGLREWEWCAGEPSPVLSSPEAAVESYGEDKNNDGNDSVKTSYRKRQGAFTYTRSDDPVFRGRKAEISRRRRNMVVWISGDFGEEVDDPEFVPLFFDDEA